MESIVEAQGLSKHFLIGDRSPMVDAALQLLRSKKLAARRVVALEDVSFKVAPGEIVGLVGTNGSGKTTLLKILSRIVSPTAGKALVRGRVVPLLDVTAGFHVDLTGRENIYFASAIRGMSRHEARAKIDSIAAMAGVERFLDTPVKKYSAGMFFRLGMSVAAHLDADLVLMDEVLAAADSAFQQQCFAMMEQAAAHGRAVIFVSHQLELVRTLCSRCLWIDRGRLVADGEVASVLERYQQCVDAAPRKMESTL